jgi:biopolymer transport protein ExbB
MAITERGNIKLSLLSKGIYEALYTTFFGLIVAIISLLFYNYFVSKNKKIVSRIRNAINKEGGISED